MFGTIRKTGVALAALLSAGLIVGCSSSTESGDPNDLDLLTQVLETNADLAERMYSDSVDTLVDLKETIDALVETPTEENLAAAKDAWLVANEAYGATEVYRFRGSPIDGEELGDIELQINAWPLGEALIDYVVPGEDFGDDEYGVTNHETGVEDPIPNNNIINSTSIDITPELLSMGIADIDERDVISGYHAIEFLLWGQDLNAGGDGDLPRDTTPGQRPVTDFVADATCTSGSAISEAVICERRGLYLQVAVAKLIDDLTQVRDAWQPGASYRDEFTSPSDLDEAKARFLEILTGMGTLAEGELAGERMQIALTTDSQEDEHSCFSDNTHRDIVLNAEGIYFLYLGDYPGYDSDLDGVVDVTARAFTGYGIDDYLEDVGFGTLASETNAAFETTQTGYTAIDALARDETDKTPVDNQIADANAPEAAPMRDTIEALNAEAQQLVKIAEDLKVGDGDDVIQDDASDCDTSDPTSEC